MSDRHALLADPMDQQTPAMHGQTSVTVRHEDLRVVETAIPTAPEVFASRQPVTNVLAETTRTAISARYTLDRRASTEQSLRVRSGECGQEATDGQPTTST